MIKAFVVDNDRLRVVDDLLANGDAVVWADLLNPTKEEEATIESWLGVAIPTREEMEEIEISSRLYVEDGAYFMTATLPAQTEVDDPLMSPVTFVLAATLTLLSVPVEMAPPSPGWRLAAAVRASIRDSAAGPPAGRALLPALVAGDESALSEETRADFRVSGLTHLLAVSGTNLTLVVGFLVLLGRWLGVRGRGQYLVAVLGIAPAAQAATSPTART